MNEQAKIVAKYIKEAKNVVFFTGAGMSTGSGIPDFRSQGGIYDHAEELGFGREEVLSRSFLERQPEDAYYFLKLFTFEETRPNSGHEFIAELEDLGKNVEVVTQNCDRLHQAAGSSKVYELHGNSVYWKTFDSKDYIPYEDVVWKDKIAYNKEGRRVRPDIVLFGENLDSDTVSKSIRAIANADLLFILGTSLSVYPAASFIDYYSGDKLVLVNNSEVGRYVQVDVQSNENIVDFFIEVEKELNI